MNNVLAKGQPAPLIQTMDVNGKKVNLTKVGSKAVLLVFLRYAGCPWCNLTLHRLALEHSLLKKNGCEVVAFVQSSAESIRENVYGQQATKPPFSIVADPDRLFYDQYGVRNSAVAAAKSLLKLPAWAQAVRQHGFKQGKVDGDFFLVPAMFLVDVKTQKIMMADYGSSFYDHSTFTGIYQPLTFREL